MRRTLFLRFALTALAWVLATPVEAQSPFQSAPGPAPAARPAPAVRAPAAPRRNRDRDRDEEPVNEPASTNDQLPPATVETIAPREPPKPIEVTINYSVTGSQAPWTWAEGGLNAAYRFGNHDGSHPQSIDSAHFRFRPGDPLTIRYISGLVQGCGWCPQVTPSGQAGERADGNDWAMFGGVPGKYMAPPVLAGELIGAFARGAIVGQPIALGVGPTEVKVPAGATRLQLGPNFARYEAGIGLWNLSVSGLHPMSP